MPLFWALLVFFSYISTYCFRDLQIYVSCLYILTHLFYLEGLKFLHELLVCMKLQFSSSLFYLCLSHTSRCYFLCLCLSLFLFFLYLFSFFGFIYQLNWTADPCLMVICYLDAPWLLYVWSSSCHLPSFISLTQLFSSCILFWVLYSLVASSFSSSIHKWS